MNMEHTGEEAVTETSNVITQMIDVASTADMVRMLEECDAEIFNGWGGSKGIFDEKTRQTLCHLIPLMRNHLQEPEKIVVISGCGTSGRLAFLISRTVNALWKPESVEYLIAGGDRALFASQEAQEDEPLVGIEDLKKVSTGKKGVLYIGVTCGLSAPYVAGQLHHCVQNLDIFTPVLIGFNPIHLARSHVIPGWDQSFLQVACQIEILCTSQKGFILNPIIGPEPITGSSRMKSGSATKMILETLFFLALQKSNVDINQQVASMLCSYREVREAINKERKYVSSIAEKAGHCLLQGGTIAYVSGEHVGLVGMVDATECPPTFGADFSDIRCFLKGGFTFFGNKSGDLSNFVQISLQYFKEEILPSLTKNDLIIHLTTGNDSSLVTDLSMVSSAATNVSIKVTCSSETFNTPSAPDDLDMNVNLPGKDLFIVEHHEQVFQSVYIEMAFKWICNAITTIGHIVKGKIFSNNMVDVMVSNRKLYYRSIKIIQFTTKCSTEKAEEALLKSIYETDELSSRHLQAEVSDHIRVATLVKRVVPTAILICVLVNCTVQEAKLKLVENPVTRAAILQNFG